MPLKRLRLFDTVTRCLDPGAGDRIVIHNLMDGLRTTESSAAPRIVRFGVFELNRDSGELRKHGLRIKLQGQPIQVLGMLLERPGEVVTRDELQKRLWPGDMFVDFDHSLNAAMKRLRAALGDSADAPLYVETLARRGYRFIAPLSQGPAREEAPAAPEPVDALPPAPVARRSSKMPIVIAAAAVLLVTAIGLSLAGVRRHQTAPGSVRSLVVLPLANLSGDRDQDYFVDGMTDALRQHLESIRALRVISRTSSMHYRGSSKTLPEIAGELKVDAAVEGSVLRSGDRVRITVELVEAGTETHLWGNSFEGDLRDAFALQMRVAAKIADEIRVSLTPPDRARLARVHAPNAAAYLAYAKGRFLWNRRTEADMKKAIAFFQEAIEKDRDYALAYDGLADCWVALGWYGYLSPVQTFPHAKEAVNRALALDDSLAEAHTSLAFVSVYYDRDWEKAEREFRRAIELNPNYANAHHWYAEFLSLAGRHEQAIVQSERARELDPLSNIINTWVGSRYFFARQYDKAIEQYRNALEMDPAFVPVHLVLGQAYEQKRMYREAIAELQRAVNLSGPSPVYLAALAHAYGMAGRRSEAQACVVELESMSKQKYVSSVDLALAQLGLGRKTEALALLEQALEEGSPRVAFLGIDPHFDPLRSDARFQRLIARIGISGRSSGALAALR
jgi:TolB-like protein/DNA-binding winged helix-turn-helix (wHTH) protein/Tfp pilus assembly protein PilF